MAIRPRSLLLSLAIGILLVQAQLPASAAPQEVIYLLPTSPNAPAFAPWMIARQNGYYADENLKVDFVAGKGGVDVAKQIGAGNAIIGGAIGDTPIIARSNGVPVRAVAVLGAGSLMQLTVRDDGPIKTTKDLKGKTVTTVAYTDTSYYSLLGSLRKSGLSRDDVSIEAAGPAGAWQLFAAGKSDAMAAVPEWIVAAENAGVKTRIMPASEGFQSMAQAILASDDAIKNHPDLVKRLVRATLRGMAEIIRDPKAATAAYIKAVPSFAGQEASIERILTMYRDRIYGHQKVLGEIDSTRLDAVQKFYYSEGIVRKTTPLEMLYTNQFVGINK